MAAAATLSLHRLAAGLVARHAAAAARLPPPFAPLRPLSAAVCITGSHALCSTSVAPCAALPWHAVHPLRRQQRQRRRPPAASYSVVTGDSGSGGTGSRGPWKLIVYSKEGCHLCDGLKEKLEAVIDRAAFLPSAFSTAELEVRDITTNPEWEKLYAMTIPVLAMADASGGGEVVVPRPSPRFSAEALQRHVERFLEKQQQQAQ